MCSIVGGGAIAQLALFSADKYSKRVIAKVGESQELDEKVARSDGDKTHMAAVD